MKPAEFLSVVAHPQSKAEQNNHGDHYQERNFLVYSQAYPRHGMEFELTKHNHEKGGSTISACYKTQGNRPRAMEAWRILKHSLAGRELNAQLVEKIDTELRKLAGASDFTDTGQPRDSVSSYSNITVASSAVEQRLLPPSSSSAQAQAIHLLAPVPTGTFTFGFITQFLPYSYHAYPELALAGTASEQPPVCISFPLPIYARAGRV